MAQINWRLIDVDALDPESVFPAELLCPPQPPADLSEYQGIAQHCRQALQKGDTESALKDALSYPPYGGDENVKVNWSSQLAPARISPGLNRFTDYGAIYLPQELHLATVLEILSSIKASDMAPILKQIYGAEGGSGLLDVLMK